MLDVLLAVKNNNMSKIPNYDPSHCEHLKKVLKGLLRKGSYISEIKISLEDLLKGQYFFLERTIKFSKYQIYSTTITLLNKQSS